MTEICAIIVTYNSDERLIENVNRLNQQSVEVIIIDNNPSGITRERVVNAASLCDATVIYNERNIGLAAALNIGIQLAKNNYRWILTFDQDSIITDSFIDNLMEAYSSYPNHDLLAIVAPFFKDQTTGIIQTFCDQKAEENELYAVATTTNTSGNLIASHIFDKVGLFREDFFIDYIDNEFCLRCRDKGYNIIESTKACLLHNVGEPRQHKFLWKRPLSSNHTPLRHYYITRNRIVVYKMYFTKFTRWVLYDIYLMIKNMIKVLIYEEDAIRKYYWMLRGAQDAMLNRMGPIKT